MNKNSNENLQKQGQLDKRVGMKEIQEFQISMFKNYMKFCIGLAYFIALYLTILSFLQKTDIYLKDILINSVGGTVSYMIMNLKLTQSTFTMISISLILLCYIPEVEVSLSSTNYVSMLKIQQVYLFYNNTCQISPLTQIQKNVLNLIGQIYVILRFNYYNRASPDEQIRILDIFPNLVTVITMQMWNIKDHYEIMQFILENYQKSMEVEKQWLQSLKNLPYGIMIYQINAQKILFDNFKLKNLFCGQSSVSQTGNQNNCSQQSIKQNKIYDCIVKQKNTQFEGKNFSLKDNQNDAKSEDKLQKNKGLTFMQLIIQQIKKTQEDFSLQSSQEKLLKEGQDEFELSLYKIEHNKKKINVQTNVFTGNFQQYAIVSVSDITNLKNFQKEKVQNKFKNLYQQLIAQNLRVPLNNIININERLMGYYQEDLLIQSSLKICNQQCLLQLDMSDQIKELSNIQLNRFELQQKLFNLRDQIIEFFEIQGLSAQLKGLQFFIVIEKLVPKFIKSDQKKIKQILFNLINNAIKFTQNGYIKLYIKVREQKEKLFQSNIFDLQDLDIVFIVEDSGKGISSEDQDNMSQLFQSINIPELFQDSGVGLGLAYCKQTIQKMGGEIRFESQKGKGTKFSFYIKTQFQYGDNGLSNQEDQQLRISIDKIRINNQNLVQNMFNCFENDLNNQKKQQDYDSDNEIISKNTFNESHHDEININNQEDLSQSKIIRGMLKYTSNQVKINSELFDN